MKYIPIFCLLVVSFCFSQEVAQKKSITTDLKAVIDTIWETEQTPIRMRDAAMKRYGLESKEYKNYHKIVKQNHAVNEQKVKEILNTYGWPSQDMTGVRGNWTLCNVIQHSDNSVRIHYLPLMRKAVKEGKLEARFLVRAEDRIATEKGELQLYGGQMKYYPETKSFNLWPVYDPANIDKRRAAIGLEPIAVFLKNRFNFEWNLEEQLKRTEAFLKEQKKQD
ncbi:MAG: DUF6624 domain-containing protein [Bacteroidota bacterium]